MTEEQKQILIKDLCGRLPYGVKVLLVKEGVVGVLGNIYMYLERGDNGVTEIKCATRFYGESNIPIEEFKPYLLPLSSMTKEQKDEFYEMIRPVILEGFKEDETLCYDRDEENRPITTKLVAPDVVETDWLNAHHFDYRGLIEQGLAIDATDMDIY